MIYLYGVLPGGTDRCAVPEMSDGVTGPVRIADAGPFRLVYGPSDDHEIAPKRRRLLAHARTLEACAQHAPVLPMRFGLTAPDIETVAKTLTAQETVLSTAFETVAGRAEFGVRVDLARPSALTAAIAAEPDLAAEHARLAAGPPARRAAADFGRRLADRLDRRRAAAQRTMISELRRDWTRHLVRAPETDVQILAVDALFPPAEAQAVARRVEEAARATGFAPDAEPTVRMVGPNPPYSFVDLHLPSPAREAV